MELLSCHTFLSIISFFLSFRSAGAWVFRLVNKGHTHWHSFGLSFLLFRTSTISFFLLISVHGNFLRG